MNLCSEEPTQGMVNTLLNILEFDSGVVVSHHELQVVGLPLVGSLQLLLQYIYSYPPYLEAIPSSAKWCHAVLHWWWVHFIVSHL